MPLCCHCNLAKLGLNISRLAQTEFSSDQAAGGTKPHSAVCLFIQANTATWPVLVLAPLSPLLPSKLRLSRLDQLQADLQVTEINNCRATTVFKSNTSRAQQHSQRATTSFSSGPTRSLDNLFFATFSRLSEWWRLHCAHWLPATMCAKRRQF